MRWMRFALIIIILGLLAYVLTSADLKEAYNALNQVDGFYFFLAFVSYLASFFIFALRNLYFFSWLLKPGYLFLLETVFAGFFLNTITPGAQIGGDPAKAYAFGIKYKKPISKTLGVVFADKVIHVLVLFFFIVFSIIYLITFIPLQYEFRFILQALLLIIFLVFAIIPILGMIKKKTDLAYAFQKSRWLSWLNPFRNNPKLQKAIGKGIRNFTEAFRETIKDKKIFILGIVFSMIYWFLNYLVSYFLFLSLGIKINFLLVIVVFSLVNFAAAFIPTPGGIGFIEGFMVFLYSLVGVGFTAALVVSLLTRVIFYFYSIVIGGIALIHIEGSLKQDYPKIY